MKNHKQLYERRIHLSLFVEIVYYSSDYGNISDFDVSVRLCRQEIVVETNVKEHLTIEFTSLVHFY